MISARVILVLGLSAVSLTVVNAGKCFSCSGNGCENVAMLGNVEDCGDAVTSCYSKFSGYKLTERGCYPGAGGAVQCDAPDCATCDEDYCNELSRANHKCVVCSSVIDKDCVNVPASLALTTQCGAATLDVSASQCYSRVVGSVTERGCVRQQEDLDGCTWPNCETCAGENCNNQEYPEDRQKCVQCDGMQCNAITDTDYCDRPADSCVTVQRTDGTYYKNCESVMSDTDRQYCQGSAASCSFCGKQECNKAAINANQKCYSCEGTACLQTSVEIEACHLIDDACFSMFDGFNPIRRGCFSSLSEQDRLVCLNDADGDCELCEQENCNLISRQDHKCAYCSSVLNANCISAPDNLVLCPAPSTEVSADAQCYTRVVDKVTERGCLGSTADALECRSSENCQTCKIEDGVACNLQIFPEERSRCVEGTTVGQYCADPNDACVQILNAVVRTRKCQSSLSADEVSFCEANSNKCRFCVGNNCNQQDVAFNFVECLSCQSSTDASCTTNPTAIAAVDQCTSPCATIISGSTLKRGCLTSLTQTEQQQCTAGNQCDTCTDNRCNKNIFPANRLRCYTCLQGECYSHDRLSLEYCPNYVAGDSCVIQQDATGNLLRLGCRSSLSSAEVSSCAANPALCRTCNTADCNDPVKMMSTGSCIQCDSLTDPNCIGRASSFDAEPCNDPLTTHCYTRMISGRIVRGCVSDLSSSDKTKCSQGQDCHQCDAVTKKCNTDIYPADRMACYTCSEPPCISHETLTLEYCPTYQTSERCVAITDAKTGLATRLGCKSTLSSTELAPCTANSGQCHQCATKGCNDPATFMRASKCVQCSSRIDPDCIGAASKFVEEPCDNPLNAQCYSRLSSDGTATERGCLSDLDTATISRCLSGTNCTLCSIRNKCNIYEYPPQIKCHQCDSTQTPSCAGSQPAGAATYCNTYSADNLCYTVVQKNGVTVRKCSTKARPDECEGMDRCEVCLFNGCNSRNSTTITAAIIPTTTPAPHKNSADANFVGRRSLAAMLVMMVMGIFVIV